MSRNTLLIGILVVAMLASFLPAAMFVQEAAAQEEFILRVGVQDETKTRNSIRFNFFTGDVWTADVLNPVHAGTIIEHPDTLARMPWAMVGTDQDGDRALDANEIGVFAAEPGNPEFWTAFYDIRGMRFHDGTQVEMEDVLMGYHLEGLGPGGDRFLKDLTGGAGSNHTSTRWLWVNPVTLTGWHDGPVADADYQFAFQFKQTGPNAQFDRTSLQTVVLPKYFWEGTGVRKQDGQVVATNIHPDFGYVIDPATMNGVPVGGALRPFDIVAASEWDAQDEDVIGIGEYIFDTWDPGVIARVERNPDVWQPTDPLIRQTAVNAGHRVPALDAIVYRLFRNVQAGIFALQSGEVDFLDWFVPPEFVPPLIADPNVGIITSADAGFFYISFNFRRLPFGYTDPALGSNVPGNDIGKPFRTAVAHAIDKRTIVTQLLQNFGVAGHTVVSPTNTLYYNASAPRYDFDLALAASILDNAGWTDPAGACQRDGSGCRSLPGKGTALFEILTPQADYDPIRAAAGALIAQNLRSIGINVDSKPTAFGQIVVRVFEEQDFDMWILGWSLTGFIVPSYIEDFFHSRNTVLDGDNPEGYNNASLDAIIDSAEGATDPDEAVRLWKQAQGIIAGDVAYDPLYYRTNIFAFRQDRIDPASWSIDIGGDVYYYWSLIMLDPAPPGAIRTSASAPSAVASGGSASIAVTVRDPDGNRLSGADVQLTVASGPGSVSPTSGTTGANGELTSTFSAPTLAADDTALSTFIDIAVSHPTLGAARTITIVITTFPPGAQFLSIVVETPFGNAVDEGGTTVIDIAVTDENGLSAGGADVLLTPTPAVTLTPASYTTDATGERSVVFEAPSVTADAAYAITISADRAGVEGETQVTITVLDVPAPPAAGISGTLLLIIGAVIGVGAAGGLYVGLRRRKK